MAMKNQHRYRGFSLTETLLAVAALAIGMIFIAGVFPAAIHSTTIATERTTAAVVADEAFAKIKIYDVNLGLLPATGCYDFNDVSGIWPVPINPDEFAYPSTSTLTEKQYYWSALCRRVDESDVQVTVFVSRKVGSGARYWERDPVTEDLIPTATVPVPVWVNVLATGNPYELLIEDVVPLDGIEKTLINDGYTIVDDETGDIYRVLERYRDNDTIVLLDRPWDAGIIFPDKVWVVPPPVGGGRYPCIAIYQKVIRF